ncbi:MAG: M56 family metallopeptidase [Chloroflexia bacterium]
MSASRYFRRLLAVAGATTTLFLAAVVSPLIVARLLSGDFGADQGDFLVCLFIPTSADWPSHLLSYSLAGLLSASMLAGVTSLVRQWYRTRRVVGMLLKLRGASSMSGLGSGSLVKLDTRIDFIRLDRPVAFCYGWLRPRICLSTGAISGLSKREIEALLLHESHHVLCRDPLKSAVARVVASAFFFLPVIAALQAQYLLAKEIEADEYALHVQGSDRPLLGALYKLLLRQAQPEASGLAVAGAAEAINQRLDYLLDKRVPAGPHLPAIFVSSFMITATSTLLTLTTWAAAASAFWHQAHSGLGGC